MTTGIRKMHSKGCAGDGGGRCNCGAGWEAAVDSKRDDKKIRKTFPTKAAARTWRADAGTQLKRGALRAPTKTTLREAAKVWLRGAEVGEIRNNSGHPYKPSTLRGYRQALEERVLPEIGAAKLSEITTSDLHLWTAGRLSAPRPLRYRNTIKPLQAIYRRAIVTGVVLNPTGDSLCRRCGASRADRPPPRGGPA